jgi:hypothetical protein
LAINVKDVDLHARSAQALNLLLNEDPARWVLRRWIHVRDEDDAQELVAVDVVPKHRVGRKKECSYELGRSFGAGWRAPMTEGVRPFHRSQCHAG